jgi:hypothetical protein
MSFSRFTRSYIPRRRHSYTASVNNRNGKKRGPIGPRSKFQPNESLLCRALGYLGQLGERIRVTHGNVGQYLAIQHHPGLLEAMDEATVR